MEVYEKLVIDADTEIVIDQVNEVTEEKEEISEFDKLEIKEMNIDDCTVIDICNVVPLVPVVLGMKCKLKDSKEIINIGVPGFINKESGTFFSFDGKTIQADGFDYHLDKILKGGNV